MSDSTPLSKRTRITCAKAARLRIALVSDTHGFVDPRIVETVRACDHVLHAGDVGSRGVLAALRAGRRRVLAVRGNNDTSARWPAGERRDLHRLPDEIELALPGGSVVVVHGDRVLPAAGRHERLRRLYPHARAVVYGHSHRLVCDQQAVPWILNPGAAGRARTFGGPSFLVLEAGARAWGVRVLQFPPIPV